MMRRQSRWLTPILALRDLKHEGVLTSALVLAIGAVITPLLLLLGLKYGIVEFQVTRLVEDPSFRELTPARAVEVAPETIERWRGRADVAFVAPGVARGASPVTLTAAGAQGPYRLDAVASSAGDPLLLENGAAAPREGEVVLSFRAATKLFALTRQPGAKATPDVTLAELRKDLVGREARVEVGRSLGGRLQRARAEVRISGVLEPRADALDRAYLTLDLVEAIEEYRSGFRSALTGGVDTAPDATQTYDRLLLIGERPISRGLESRVTNGTGVSDIRPIENAAEYFSGGLKAAPRSGALTWELTATGSSLLQSNIRAVRRQLAGAPLRRVALVDPMPATFVTGETRRAATVFGEPDADTMRAMGAAPTLPEAASLERGVAIAAPASWGLAVGAEGVLEVELDGYRLELPGRIAASIDAEQIRVPMTVLAQLRTGRDRRVLFDQESGALKMTKEGYRGFRLYARSIYDVGALSGALAAEGIEIIAQDGPIQRVQELERALDQLFFLVAIVGVAGAVAAMAASLIAAVERKRRAIGMMRLLGLSRRSIFFFPIVQAAAVALFATGFAVIAFLLLSAVINRTFAEALPLGERLCYLPPSYLAGSFVVTTAVAVASAVVAARRATRIDPADAIREE